MEEVLLKLPGQLVAESEPGSDALSLPPLPRPPLLLSFQPAKCLHSSVPYFHCLHTCLNSISSSGSLSHCQYPGNGNHTWLILLSAYHSSHTDRSPRKTTQKTDSKSGDATKQTQNSRTGLSTQIQGNISGPPSSSTSPLTKWEIASMKVFTRGDLNMSEYIGYFLALGSYRVLSSSRITIYLYKHIASFPTSG